jgi:hypothetical protein
MTDAEKPPDPFGATSLSTGDELAVFKAARAANPPVVPPAAPSAPSPAAQTVVPAAVPPRESLAGGDAILGRVIKGRYKLKRLIGEGGMGGVYEGEHLEIGKRVAIKLVHTVHARDPHIAARIKQEARSTGAIESENIVQVFDAGEDEDLGLFLVMELLKGEDLSTLLARKGRISPLGAASIVIQSAQGLARAHAVGIVHRDLKPANIFLCTRDDGSTLVKLVDFGIAKLLRDANRTQGPGLTRMGMVLGTPQYMSPEQAQGLPSVDHRTDIYSLGCVLFEMLIGSSPFPEMPTYEQTIIQIMTRSTPRMSEVVPSIHPGLDQLCADMMAREPGARPSDMSVVRDRLTRLLPEIGGAIAPARPIGESVPPGVVDGPSAPRVSRPGLGYEQPSANLRVAGHGGPPATHSAMAVTPGVRGLAASLVEPVDLPGVNATNWTAVLVGAAAALVGVLLGMFLLVSRGNRTDSGGPTATVPTSATTEAPPATASASGEAAPAPTAPSATTGTTEIAVAPPLADAGAAAAGPIAHRQGRPNPKQEPKVPNGDKPAPKPEEHSLGAISAPDTWDTPAPAAPKH